MGRPFFPQNCPFAWGIWSSRLINGSLCPAESHDRDRQTHRQRDHARYHVCDNRPHYNTVLEMWANAQRDGRPAEYRWRPLFNAAKFG